jgi:hypothetical protein
MPFPLLPTGIQNVIVDVPGQGYANPGATTLKFTSRLDVQPLLGAVAGGISQGGGAVITLPGRGFAEGLSTVTVCGASATVLSANYTSLTFVAPPMPTAAQLTALPPPSLQKFTGTVTGLGRLGPYYALAFDGDVGTTSKAMSASCNVGLDLGAAFVGSLRQIRYFPSLLRALTMSNGAFQVRGWAFRWPVGVCVWGGGGKECRVWVLPGICAGLDGWEVELVRACVRVWGWWWWWWWWGGGGLPRACAGPAQNAFVLPCA